MSENDTSNQLRNAGDVNIDKVQITTSKGATQNITNQVIGIVYYEDLFSPFITGEIQVKDSLAVTNILKFTGEEYVDIKFSTPTLNRPIEGKFYVHKMSDKQQLGDRQSAYSLHFISIESVVDINKKVSKKYNGKVSDLVSSILKSKTHGLETDKRCNVEDTTTSSTWISNYWSPLKNIQWCTSKAKNINDVPNFIFYENKHGFNFVSLDSLYTNPVVQQFVNDKYTRDDLGNDGRTAANPEEDYKRVLSLEMPKSYGDTLEKIRSGTYASRVMTFDVTHKTYTAKNYNFYQKFSRQQHLNANPINSGNLVARPSAALMFKPKMGSNFSGTTDNTNFTFIQERISTLASANAHRVEISVLGRTDYTVGQKVNLDLMKTQPMRETDDQADLNDRLFSGNYLISAIAHNVTRKQHECHMELIKDSLVADPNTIGEK